MISSGTDAKQNIDKQKIIITEEEAKENRENNKSKNENLVIQNQPESGENSILVKNTGKLQNRGFTVTHISYCDWL